MVKELEGLPLSERKQSPGVCCTISAATARSWNELMRRIEDPDLPETSGGESKTPRTGDRGTWKPPCASNRPGGMNLMVSFNIGSHAVYAA